MKLDFALHLLTTAMKLDNNYLLSKVRDRFFHAERACFFENIGNRGEKTFIVNLFDVYRESERATGERSKNDKRLIFHNERRGKMH